MNAPRVSYVIASYNHERFVGPLLESIRRQAFDSLEIIIVDDGSTDGTAAVCERYARSDQRIQLFRQSNLGVIAARNRAIAASSAPLISIVDSDDLLPPDRTERIIRALDENPHAAMVYGDAWIIDENDNRLGRFFQNYPPVPGDFSAELFANYCFVPAASVMFRRSAFEKSGPLWGPPASTDYLKWIELGLLGDVILLPGEPLGCWRWHSNNVSGQAMVKKRPLYDQLRLGLEEMIARHPDLASRLGPRRIRRRLARVHFMAGFYSGLEGEWTIAREEFQKASRIHPSLLNRLAWTSSLPGINAASSLAYRAAARARLKIRRSPSPENLIQ